MSDPVIPTTAAAPTADDMKKVQDALAEVADDLPLLKSVISDIKAKKYAELAARLPQLMVEAKEDFSAISAAVPVIKSGWQTSEFWILASIPILNTGLMIWKGQTLPVEVNGIVAGVGVLFAFLRTLLKAKVSTVAATTPPVTPVAK